MKTFNKLSLLLVFLLFCVYGKSQIKVNSNGNVGIGTSNPMELLHINGNIRGNLPSGALRINTTSGRIDLGPQNTSWAHIITDRNAFYMNRALEVDYGLIGSYNEDLSLRTGTNTRMTISYSSGYVGIGMTPSYKLDVNGSIRCTSLTETSDESLKVGIKDYTGDVSSIMLLRPVTYKIKKPDLTMIIDTITPQGDTLFVNQDSINVNLENGLYDQTQIGFLAQELEQVFPGIVTTDPNGIKSVRYTALIPVLVAAIKEQQDEIDDLKEQIQQLIPVGAQ